MHKLNYILILFLISVFVINAQEINWLTMNEALAKQKEVPKKIMVDMYTTWCGPCKMLAPIIEELSDEYAGRVTVGKVDVDNSRDSAAKYGIQSVPTIMVFQGGEPVKKFVGLMPKAKLAEALDEVLQAG